MTNLSRPTLRTTSGTFTPVSQESWTLTTGRRSYLVSIGAYSSPSVTRNYTLSVHTAGGEHVMTVPGLIRKQLKTGVRVTCRGFGSWASVDEAVEAIARHEVAAFEAWETRPAVSLSQMVGAA